MCEAADDAGLGCAAVRRCGSGGQGQSWSVPSAKHSSKALRELASNTCDEGTTVHSFGSLLHCLNSIVRTTCRRPDASTHAPTFTIDSTPYAKQIEAFERLKTIAV